MTPIMDRHDVKAGDRLITELDTKEGLFATMFFVSRVHRDGSLTVITEKCFRNGVEGRPPEPRTFRAQPDAFDWKV